MSQPSYEFFPGAHAAADSTPVEAPSPFPAPVPEQGYGGTFGAPAAPLPAAPLAPPAAPRRPTSASAVSGLLIAEAAVLGGPGVTLLLLRDVVGKALSAFSSFASGATGLGGASIAQPDTSSVTGRITLWAVLLLVTTLAAAVGATGMLAGRAWGWGLGVAVQVAGVLWAVTHIGSWPATGGTALALSLLVGAVLALPDVRRWAGVSR